VGAVGKQRSEGHDQGHIEFAGKPDDLLDELPPAHIGFDAVNEDDVPRSEGKPGNMEARGGPGELLDTRFIHPDEGPIDLVVVVVLGIQLSERGRPPDLPKMVDGVRCRFSSVIPTLESAHENRIDKFRERLELDHHPPPLDSRPARRCPHRTPTVVLSVSRRIQASATR